VNCTAFINHEIRLAEYRESLIFLVFLGPVFFPEPFVSKNL